MDPVQNSFSIDTSFSENFGSTELLNDLMSPETASTNPLEVTPIIKEVVVPEVSIEKTPDIVETEKSNSALSDFLSDDEESNVENFKEKDNNKITDNKIKDNTSISEDIQTSKFKALSNDLFKLGVFNKEEDEEDVVIDTPEEFLERFQFEKKKEANEIVENFLGQFGQDYQDAFQAIFVKGTDPKLYFSTYNEVVDYAQMDLSDENNQKTIMKKALLNQGFEDDDIESEIDRLINYGDLEQTATRHHKVLVKKEAAKLEEIQKESEIQLQQKQQQKNQYINNVKTVLTEKLKTKDFDGIPLNLNLANELQDFLLVDKWKTPSGETLTDFDRAILDLKKPENHAQKVKIAMLIKMLEKDPSLSTIQKTGITKKTDQLFSEVARQVTNTSTGKSNSSNKLFGSL